MVVVEFLFNSENVFCWEIMIVFGRRLMVEIKLVLWFFRDKGRYLFLLEVSFFIEMGKYFVRVKVMFKILIFFVEKNVSVNVLYSFKIFVLKCFYWDKNI